MITDITLPETNSGRSALKIDEENGFGPGQAEPSEQSELWFFLTTRLSSSSCNCGKFAVTCMPSTA